MGWTTGTLAEAINRRLCSPTSEPPKTGRLNEKNHKTCASCGLLPPVSPGVQSRAPLSRAGKSISARRRCLI